MNRRGYLYTVGSGIAGLSSGRSLLSRSSGKESVSGVGYLPDKDVSTRVVTPYADVFGRPQYVESSEWIIHRYGWVTDDGETPKDLRENLAVAEYEFFIDGEAIEHPSQYWDDVQPTDDDAEWVVRWEYATPPKDPGEHEFGVRMILDNPIQGNKAGERYQWSGVETESSTYEVEDFDSGQYRDRTSCEWSIVRLAPERGDDDDVLGDGFESGFNLPEDENEDRFEFEDLDRSEDDADLCEYLECDFFDDWDTV